MDIRSLFIGIIMGCFVISLGTAVIFNSAATYSVNQAEMNTTLTPIVVRYQQNFETINQTSHDMQTLFLNQEANPQSKLDALFGATGGVFKLVIGSIGVVISTINLVGSTYPLLSVMLGFAIVSFVIAIVMSIVYIIFMRINR
jgi:hypothetical protein